MIAHSAAGVDACDYTGESSVDLGSSWHADVHGVIRVDGVVRISSARPLGDLRPQPLREGPVRCEGSTSDSLRELNRYCARVARAGRQLSGQPNVLRGSAMTRWQQANAPEVQHGQSSAAANDRDVGNGGNRSPNPLTRRRAADVNSIRRVRGPSRHGPQCPNRGAVDAADRAREVLSADREFKPTPPVMNHGIHKCPTPGCDDPRCADDCGSRARRAMTGRRRRSHSPKSDQRGRHRQPNTERTNESSHSCPLCPLAPKPGA